ncbi:hypothetical protein GE061_010748 [Apolygus lucorum]|uniref:Aminomethyltransferase n=1 Tax=Apolygus lucorum TaxID=248454 RepID=A0A6A4K609_APOLU|nr:hypothetical protein GE061_010748 [Apolygus lucorum]
MFQRIIRIHGVVIVRRASSLTAQKTKLYDFHVAHQGKIVDFGGFQLPVTYATENITESHIHTRKACSVFDVSHMLQTIVTGAHRHEFMESVCTADIKGMSVNTSALSLFTDRHTGGILDDLIVTKCEDHLYVVSNASMREQDTNIMMRAKQYFKSYGKEVLLEFLSPEQQSLLAVQGPLSQKVMELLIPQVNFKNLYFMETTTAKVDGQTVRITRCGYTGEDGFEISLPSDIAPSFAERLLAQPGVKLAGLGARDTLRLEAGLCLYGNDLDKTLTPVSAGLMWTIGRRRKDLQDYPGARLIHDELLSGPAKKRVGLVCTSEKSPPVRHGTVILNENQEEVGSVTSGCPSPSLNKNIAMGYVKTSLAKVGTTLLAKVRNSLVPLTVTKMPFVPSNYYTRKSK